jgi:hypothetical protein
MNVQLKQALRPRVQKLEKNVKADTENQHEVDEALRVLEAVKAAK